jgi:uncharacterized protein
MIIYLHGYNSAFDPESEKVKELAKIGGIVPVSYDSFDTFENIIASLKEMADPLPVYEFAFAGTSLGGFFAAHMGSRFHCPAILINPAVDPFAYLTPKVDQTFENHTTGEPRVLSKAAASSYEGKAITTLKFSYLPLILLDQDDEVFSSEATVQQLGQINTHTFEGGSHRFTHIKEAMPAITYYLNTYEFVHHCD